MNFVAGHNIAKAIKVQANLHGVSTEAEHRNILKQSLTHPPKKSFAEMLSKMPNVGNDDFKLVQDFKSSYIYPI